MDMLDAINSSLAQNGNLTKEVKDNIYELVVTFNKNFPVVKLDRLNERLATLKICKSSKFINKDISMYDFRKNVLYINVKQMDKNYDLRYIMMFEILNMISSSNYQMGFNADNKFEALNVGYTTLLANFLVGNHGEELLYPDEAVEANLISIIVGPDVLYEAYFNNDTKMLVEGFTKAGVSI